MRRALFIIAWFSIAAASPLGGSENRPRQTIVLPVQIIDAGETNQAECLVTLGPVLPISALAFGIDGKQLYTGGYCEVLVWDLENATLARRIELGQASGTVRSLALQQSSGLLFIGGGSAGQAGIIQIANTSSGRVTRSLDGPKDVVECLALQPDGILLVAGSADGNLYAWDISTDKLVKTINCSARVASVVFSGDGKYVAAGGADARLRVWKLEDWQESSNMKLPEPITDLTVGLEGHMITAATAGNSEWSIRVHRFDTPAAKEPRVYHSASAAPLRLAWSQRLPPRSSRLYVGSGDNIIRAISPQKAGQSPFDMVGHADSISALVVSSDGRRVASGSLDGTIRLWSADGRPLAALLQLKPATDTWAIVTAQGYFATSSPDAMRWQMEERAMLGSVTAQLNKPEKVRDAIADLRLASKPRRAWRQNLNRGTFGQPAARERN